MARSIFVPLNIVFGVTITSLLLIKFSRVDYAKDTVDELRYGENSSHLWERSLIHAFRANLEAANDDENHQEKEFLQFLCAVLVVRVEIETFADKMMSGLDEAEKASFAAHEEDTIKKTKSSGSSMFATASSVNAQNAGWLQQQKQQQSTPINDDAAKEQFARSISIVMTQFEIYDHIEIVYLLRKFGIAFQSVQEMLRNEGPNWFLTEKDMKVANAFMKVLTGFELEWKWVDQKKKTVFPLLSVDQCQVPRQRRYEVQSNVQIL